MAEPQAQPQVQTQAAQPQVDYDALAKQYGATSAETQTQPTQPTQAANQSQGQGQSAQTQPDYDALAKQYGAVEGPSTTPQTPTFTPDAENLSTGGEGSNTDQQLMSEESQKSATKGGLRIAATAGPAVVGLAASPLIGAGTAVGALIDASGNPIVRAAAEHLINLDKIVKIAKALSWTGFGMKEAHDLYKLVSGTAK